MISTVIGGDYEMQAFTIGYAGRTFEAFVALLRQQDVEVIVDVRRFPRSKYPEFRQEFLARELPKRGIAYRHIGELGGFRGEYEKYMQSAAFDQGVQKLLALMERKRCCVMCMERNSVYCHRRFIGQYLVDRGIRVTDL